MKNLKKATIIASAALVFAMNFTAVFAATPVPSKSGASTSTSATSAPTQSTTKATAKPTAKATAKATKKPSSSTKSTAKPTEEADPSANPSDEPKVELSEQPSEPATTNTEPLVFTQEADEGVIGVNATGTNGKYTTKGGSFGWFVLSVIVNAIISFIIGNRFYKMSRKDKHILAEIRALKRDMEAKMQEQIGGFSEFETVIENSNADLGTEDKVELTKSEEDQKAEDMANEIYRKWESQIAAAKQREAAPQRRAPQNRTRRPVSKKNTGSLSGKVKDFINDVFPFDKD